MKDLSRRKFLTGAAVAVPAAAAVVALPQVVAATPEVQYEYAHGFTMDAAWPGAEVIVPDRVLESSAPLGEGGEADYTIDFEWQTVTLNAPCTGLALYQTLHKQWRETDAIKYAYPMMAITPELFAMLDGWKLEGVANLQNASMEDDGYGRRVLGCISLGQVFEDEQLMWAAGDKNVRGYWRQFSKEGHVNEGVIFPSWSETIWIRCGVQRHNMGEMCGYNDMSCEARIPIRFPLWQQITI